MPDIVKDWYADDKNVGEMLTWNKGRLKKWELEAAGDFSDGARILDIGCGLGREAFLLADMGFRPTGIDITGEIIEKVRPLAAERGYDIPFMLYDGRRLPFGDGDFDVVIIWSQTFGLLYGDEYKRELLCECRRVLAPGGLLSFSGHSRAFVTENYAHCVADGKFYPYADTELYWETFTEDELRAHAAAAGFKPLKSGEGEIYTPEDGIVLYCFAQK